MTALANTGPQPADSVSRSSLADSPDNLRSAIAYFYRFWSPRILTLVAVVGLGVRIAIGGFGLPDLLIVLAIFLLWPIIEWLVHVYVLHFKPKKIGRFVIDPPTPRQHREHHRDPWRLDRSFTPVHVYAYAVPVHLVAWNLLAANPGEAFTGITFAFVMWLQYEWIHFLIHTRYKPRGRYLQRLWRHHRLHHCKNEHYWQGVSRTLGDVILRTQPDPGSVETSQTCRTLGYAEGDPFAERPTTTTTA